MKWLFMLTLVVSLALSAAAPVIDGVPLMSDVLLRVHHECEGKMSWAEARWLILYEQELWRRTRTLETTEDLEDAASWISDWNAVEGDVRVGSPQLFALVFLESSWKRHHGTVATVPMGPYLYWRQWTGTTILYLGRQINADLAQAAFTRSQVRRGDEEGPSRATREWLREIAVARAHRQEAEDRAREQAQGPEQKAAMDAISDRQNLLLEQARLAMKAMGNEKEKDTPDNHIANPKLFNGARK